jgi:hypothetical protein
MLVAFHQSMGLRGTRWQITSRIHSAKHAVDDGFDAA